MRRAVLLCLPLLLAAGCSSGPADADVAICAEQSAALAEARATADELVAGTALVQDATPPLDEALTVLAGWVPADERLDRAVTRARDDVQTLRDDMQDQRLETQVPATALASLGAIGDVCDDLTA